MHSSPSFLSIYDNNTDQFRPRDRINLKLYETEISSDSLDDEEFPFVERERRVVDFPEIPEFEGGEVEDDGVFDDNDSDVFEPTAGDGESDADAASSPESSSDGGSRRRRRVTPIDDVSDGLPAADTDRNAAAGRSGRAGGAGGASTRRAATSADPNGDVDTFGELGPDDGDVFEGNDGSLFDDDEAL